MWAHPVCLDKVKGLNTLQWYDEGPAPVCPDVLMILGGLWQPSTLIYVMANYDAGLDVYARAAPMNRRRRSPRDRVGRTSVLSCKWRRVPQGIVMTPFS